ncbi:Predicted DNA binding protein, contains HTH domain [Halorientalis persicus]|uniref:Predicted DNA binding protein, contains HTH domain n=1 Tax=Halorientalis persicus TaxID=1367881 RepID=A0A1H8MVK5_9EURY|nr:helix-turn-helix domain-containing protein [Halorientalis persicus]SEO21290.1 Predicted DNA binding protein, contains HTH domain [Halorientalis persicus]
MRYGTFVLTPDRGWFHEIEAVFRERGVTTVGIRNVALLADGTVVLLHELNGPTEGIIEAVEETDDDLIDYQFTEADDRKMLRCHYHPGDLVDSLLTLLEEFAVLPEYPLEYVEPSQSSLKVTLIAEHDALRELIDQIPEGMSVDLLRIGTYNPDSNTLFSGLTQRKQEVARKAVEKGYYKIPREVTCEEIAAELDCSAGTVAEHLQAVESQFVTEVVPAGYDTTQRESVPSLTSS